MSNPTELIDGLTRPIGRHDLPKSFARFNPLELATRLPRRTLQDVEAPFSGTPNSCLRAEQFVLQLAEEALQNRAVRHPYLQAISSSSLPNMRWALADFARQYYGYSAHFPRYLTTVISRLENASHRQSLFENLTEESGVYADDELHELRAIGVEPAWIQGIPHPRLFQRFATALDVDVNKDEASEEVACWRELFLQLLSNGSPAEAIGALGFGTEYIVRTLYGYFVEALEEFGELTPEETVFFKLHVAVDDHHQAALQAIAVDFASSREGRAGLRRGMLKALMLRNSFWDWMYERALQPAQAKEAL